LIFEVIVQMYPRPSTTRDWNGSKAGVAVAHASVPLSDHARSSDVFPRKIRLSEAP
jgi:hypothetical protein